jgi:transaldolase
MKVTQRLHDLKQSLWLDNITRQLLDDGVLKKYIDELSITGLTSNPTIFDEAIGKTGGYDEAIRAKAKAGLSGEALFTAIALEDLRRAADLFLPVFRSSGGLDGWVSMEVSPMIADDAAASLATAIAIKAQAERPNLYVKIPGTTAGIQAIEDAIFAGVSVNVTLLFSREHYLAAAEAYLRGIERRLAAGLSPDVSSVASLFVSRWDRAVADKPLPDALRNRLGIAIGRRTYAAYRRLLESPRWRQLAESGAQPQRLLFASTGTKDPKLNPCLYVEALAAPDTVNTMPDKTLLAFAAQGKLDDVIPPDGGDCEATLREFGKSGIDIDALAVKLQQEGAASFVKSWQELMQLIVVKSSALATP